MVARRRPKNYYTPVRSQRLHLDDTNMSIDERLYEDHCTLGDTINLKMYLAPVNHQGKTAAYKLHSHSNKYLN